MNPWWRWLRALAALSAAVSLAVAVLFFLRPGAGPAARAPSNPSPASLTFERPLTVIVRGWLWDPQIREASGDLEWFPVKVNEALEGEGLPPTEFLQYRWSRTPADVFAASREFTEYARGLAEAARARRRCVNFLGHSAGAAFVYRAASEGVSMGLMGTLGLPTAGALKPPGVFWWANFYTTTHTSDVAGRLWAPDMDADVQLDLQTPHYTFWGRQEVVEAIADGIARSWRSEPPNPPCYVNM